MRVFKNIFFFIIILSCSTNAADVEFINPDSTVPQLVSSYMKEHCEEPVLDSLRQLLIDFGYLDADIRLDSTMDGGSITVDAGRIYYLDKIIIDYEQSDTVSCNCPLNRFSIEKVIDSLLDIYQAKGYYYASITPSNSSGSGNYLIVYIKLNPGPIVTVSAIEFEGTHKTNHRFLSKYIAVNSGDTLNIQLLKKSERSLARLDFVSLKKGPEIIPEPGYRTGKIRYSFLEKKQFDFEGVGGYLPDDGGYFVWYLKLRGRNIFGSGQKAGLIADRKEKNRSIFEIYYGQPVFLMGMGHATINLLTRDFREQFYEFGISLTYDIDLNNQLTLSTSLAWKNVEPTDTLARAFHTYDAGVGVKAGQTVYKKNQSSFLADWKIKYSGRRYKSSEYEPSIQQAVYNDTRNILNLAATFPIISRFSNHYHAELHDIKSSEKPLPFSELFFLGGPTSLRGYRTDQFTARRSILLNSELWLFLSDRDYLYSFYDIAYFEWYHQDSNSVVFKNEATRYGYGIGIVLSSQNNQLKAELAWAEDSNLDEPRINIQIGTQF